MSDTAPTDRKAVISCPSCHGSGRVWLAIPPYQPKTPKPIELVMPDAVGWWWCRPRQHYIPGDELCVEVTSVEEGNVIVRFGRDHDVIQPATPDRQAWFHDLVWVRAERPWITGKLRPQNPGSAGAEHEGLRRAQLTDPTVRTMLRCGLPLEDIITELVSEKQRLLDASVTSATLNPAAPLVIQMADAPSGGILSKKEELPLADPQPEPVDASGLEIGDYVLATKYGDGDPKDHWCVGFYAGLTNPDKYRHEPRYDVVDNEGENFRGNGFRRVQKITAERGAWILRRAKDIELSGKSLWYFVRCAMD